MEPVRTTCTLDCPDRCSILCRREESGLAVAGDPENPYTRGFTCGKIRRYPGRLQSPHRIREPWIRRGDHHVPATWDEALQTICDALSEARAAGPGSILLLRGAGSMGVSKAYADYVFGLLGARGTAGSLCDAAGCAAVEADAGALRMNDPLQIDAAEAVVLWGKNPKASSIHTAAQLSRARKRGVPVVAVNPDASAVADLADCVIRLKPGSDRYLALAVAKRLIGETARPIPWDLAANRSAFEDLLRGLDDGVLREAADVTAEDVRVLAAPYLRTNRVATIAGWGLQRHPFGGESTRAIHALAFLAGTLGVPGGGFYYSVPSARHLRRPRPPVVAPRPLVLPDLAREVLAADPPIRVAWLLCTNFLNQGPDAKAAREAFERIPTVVAVEGFWTETVRRASVVLPPTLWLEEDDLVASYWHRGVGAVARAVEPPAGCRSDFDIVQDVARRLGITTPYATCDAWLSACLPPDAPSLGQIREKGWHLFEEPEVAWARGFAHEGGKFRLLDALSPEPPADGHHPLAFLTLIRAETLHSQFLPEEQRGPLPVRLNPQTAEAFGLSSGSPVRIVSATGEVEAEVHLDPGLHAGAAACPRGGWLSLGLGVNEATEARITDLGQGAAFYGTRVRLERISRA